MDEILADDFVLVTDRGASLTKADLIKEAQEKRTIYEHQEVDGRHAESANMARHGCCYCPVESERHERPKPLRLRSVVESDLCSDAYWLALCIWASFETGSKIVFNHLPSSLLPR